MEAEYDLAAMKSRPNPYAERLKKQVTLRVSDNVIDYFEGMAREIGIPYEILIDLYPRQSSISQAASPEEIGELWDSHSLADYWDETHEVDVEVRAERRRRVTLAPEVYTGIEALARRKGILTETLVNLWLVERLQKAG